MSKRVTIAAISVAAAGLAAAALIVPGVASGNARNIDGSGLGATRTATPLVALLSGANEVPPADPDGSGAAAVTVDLDAGEVCYDVSYKDIGTVVGSHIHQAVAGQNGPIVVPLTALPGANHGCELVADATLLAHILATPADFYVNIHTSDFGTGAIRGQLSTGPAPAGPVHFLATPLRSYDSRVGAGVLKPNETRTISLQTGKTLAGTTELAVPPGATGAIVNLTVTETVEGGFVKLYSAAVVEPATSTINWSESGQNLAANTSVAVDANGAVKITGGVHDTQVVLDVVGYYF